MTFSPALPARPAIGHQRAATAGFTDSATAPVLTRPARDAPARPRSDERLTARGQTLARLAILARVTAAIPANYILTAILTALMGRLLPMARNEAVTAATMVSFAIFAVIAMAVFHAPSVRRIWLWLSGSMLMFGTMLAVSIAVGGRL